MNIARVGWLVAVLACAAPPAWAESVGSQAGVQPRNPKDPLEPMNRGIYRFNKALDDALLRPVAKAYQDTLPSPIRQGVGNFLGNLWDVWSAVNQLLQGKVVESAQMTLRFGVNTVFGLGGLLDPATELHLPRQSEDFGQTLGRWGFPAGPYLVLPLLGPSSVRDATGKLLDRQVAPSSYFSPDSAQWAVTSVEVVDTRAQLLGVDSLMADVALDEYLFLRDGYLARRQNLVYDGDPPQEPEEALPLEEADGPGEDLAPAPASSAPAPADAAAAPTAPPSAVPPETAASASEPNPAPAR